MLCDYSSLVYLVATMKAEMYLIFSLGIISVILIQDIEASSVRSDRQRLGCQERGCTNGYCVQAGPTSFGCLCYQGFTLHKTDPTICTDIDECKVGGGSVCRIGRCINSPGSYSCMCPPWARPTRNNQDCVPRRRRQTYPRYYNPYSYLNFNPFMWYYWSELAENMF